MQRQDSSAVINQNKWRRKHVKNESLRRSGKFFEIANISNGIYLMWKDMYGVDVLNKDHFPAVMQLIHSQDWSASVKVVDGNFMKAPVKQHFAGARSRSTHPLASNRATRNGGSGGLIDTGSWRK